MSTLIRRAGGLVILVFSAALTACGGSDGGTNFNPPPPPPPPPPPVGAIQLTRVFAGVALNQPVALMQAPGDDARWFAVTQGGIIHVFDNDAPGSNQAPFADLRGRVTTGGEAGLLGMAFHPDFGTGNFDVIVSYTRAGSPLESVVSRISSNDGGNTLDLATESIILTIPQSRTNHNGGMVAFGPDGRLYAGWGDGGGAGDPDDNGQDTSNLLGTIMRIDIDGTAPYEIPPDNPFSGQTECMQGFGSMPCPEIYAWGFRNPWRWSFDRQTGELWVGDVGQNAWEEIDRIEIGMNYGWNEREGAHCFDPPSGCATNFVDPITEYSHSVGSSVTGGYVYRGTAIPGLVGQYVFGDFGTGRIWRVPATSAIGTTPTELLDSPYNISSFGEDNAGELYLLDYSTGAIYQLAEQ